MAECDRWAPVFWVRTCSEHSIFLGKVVQSVKGYNSALFSAQTPMASMCCIRSEVKIHESAVVTVTGALSRVLLLHERDKTGSY